MSAEDVDRFTRERREADMRYNVALTELDRAIVSAAGESTLSRDAVERVGTALVVFLQQITAFVDTKDREIAAGLAGRFEALGPALESIGELHAQIGVIQRSIQAWRRDVAGRPEGPLQESRKASPLPESHDSGRGRSSDRPDITDDVTYVAFEDQFRGSDETIRERLRTYVPIFAGASDVLDVGCGRGELLAALKEAGISARGVDTNGEMAAIARERGLAADQGDALTYLASQPDESIGGLIATQVVEHLEPPYLIRLLDTASRKLRPRAPIVLETINPACWLAFFSSYIRDLTHVRPIHPETLQFLLRAHGFERVEIRYAAPVPAHMKMQTIDLPAEILGSDAPSAVAASRIAHALNANAVVLNNLMFTHLDYAAIGYRS